MKILFVIPGYEPAWAFGGTTTGQAALARAMVANGHDVTVYTTAADGQGRYLDVPQMTPVDQGGVRVVYHPCTIGPRSVFDSRALMRSLRENVRHFDVVYLLALYQWIGVETPSICADRGVPVVFHIAGSLNPLLFKRGRLKKAVWYRLFLERALKRCSALHLTGQYEREQTRVLLPWASTYIVPNCVSTERFSPRPDLRAAHREKYGLTDDIPTLCAVGRIDPKKRLDYLIVAAGQLKREGREFRLLIACDDSVPLAQEFKQLAAEHDVTDHITWTGMLSGDDMVGLYAASDMFVHLSEDENFGIVVVEAMATGLPVLVTPGVGAWHFFKDEGVGRCVELTTDGAAEGIRDFIDNRQTYEPMGERARDVAKDFEATKVAALMVRAFQDTIDGTQSPECQWELAN